MKKAFSIILLTFFLVNLLTKVQAYVAPDQSENIVDVDRTDNDLEQKIQELKEKVRNIIDQGKTNEKAFIQMTEQVKSMDAKVKDMTRRLKAINAADYLNEGVEEIKKL